MNLYKGLKYLVILSVTYYLLITSKNVFGYASADVPIRHWAYEAVEKLAIAGLLSISGIESKPLTRVQFAYKIKEAIDNIENERLPRQLGLDREYEEYLQNFLYKLIDEFRDELISIGVSVVQIKPQSQSGINRFLDVNLFWPVEVEHRYGSFDTVKDVLLENENGLRISEGYNLRARSESWLNILKLISLSARVSVKATKNETEVYLDEAGVSLSLFNTIISAQRSAMWWGPGYHGAMLMSNNARPLELVRIKNVRPFALPGQLKHIGRFEINFFISKLGKDRKIPEPNIIGLRIDYAPLPYLNLGASRVIIAGGKGRPKPHLRDYWKMFMARSKDEFSEGQIKRTDTDQLASLDIAFMLPMSPSNPLLSGLKAYFEWSGEDRFSFWENESPGLLIGLFLTDLFRDEGTDIRIEYAKNKPAWYNHGIYNASGTATAYTYKGEIIGHHMGGDADDLFFRISKHLPFLSTPYFDAVEVGAQIDFERHKLSLPQQEKKTEVVFDVVCSHSNDISISFRYELERYKNYNLVTGSTAKNHIVLLEGTFRF